MMEMLHEGEFWVGVGFVLVVALLLWKGVPAMVGRMLDQRSTAIAAELEEARRLSAEAAALLAEYKQKAAGAEAQAAAILKEAEGQAARFAEESRAALKAQIERRGAAAQDKIAQAEAAAVNEIRSLAADVAVAGAGKLIAARMDAAKAAKLIQDSIAGLDKLN